MSRIDTKINVFKIVIFILPIVFILFCIYMKIYNNGAYREMLLEDAIIENMTCVVFLVASVIALSVARGFFKGHRATYGWLYVLAFLVCAFVGMEEISWGQRIFKTKTPEYLMEHNIQEELNLHNIDHTHSLVTGSYFLVTLFGACGWMVLQHNRMKSLKHKAKFFIPDWYLSLYFFFGFFIALYMQIATYLNRFVFLNWRDMEPGELLMSFGFCLFMGIAKYWQVREVQVEQLAVKREPGKQQTVICNGQLTLDGTTVPDK